RVQLVPGDLRLAAEDVGPDIADALALLEQGALPGGVAPGRLAQPAQIAAVLVEQHPCGIAQRARGALVVAGVAGLVQDAGALLPGRLRHLLRRGPALLRERARRLHGDLRADPRAQERRGAQPAIEHRGRVAREVDPELCRIRLA